MAMTILEVDPGTIIATFNNQLVWLDQLDQSWSHFVRLSLAAPLSISPGVTLCLKLADHPWNNEELL